MIQPELRILALHLLALLGLASVALAQAPNASKLRSLDWRERNAAARALADSPDDITADVLKVLHADWDDGIATTDRWNSAIGGGTATKEPRLTTLRGAGESIIHIYSRSKSELLNRKDQLTAPWHPHALSEWILRHRGTKSVVAGLQPTSTKLARIWLTCTKPNEAALRQALASDVTALPVATAIWELNDAVPASLLDHLTTGSIAARRAVLRLPIDYERLGAEHVRAVVQQFLTDEDSRHGRRAGGHLLKLGSRAATELIPHLATDSPNSRQALAVLCLMGPNAAPATSALLECLNYNRMSQRRALIALSNVELPADLRATAANKLFELLRTTRVRAVRTLALDALGNCGAGVDETIKNGLRAMFEDRKYRSAHARILGCMRQLQCVPKLEAKEIARIARGANPNSQTWMAVADYGEAASEALEQCIRRYQPGVDDRMVGKVLAQTAPKLLTKWLTSEHLALRARALETLQTERPELLDSSILLSLVQDESLGGDAFDALLAHKNAQKLLPKLLAATAQASLRIGEDSIKPLHKLDVSLSMLLQALDAPLRRGKYWMFVRGIDDDTLKKHARQWIQQSDDAELRDTLLAQFVRLGLSQAVDLQMVEQVLRNKQRAQTLRTLSWLESVPRELIPVLGSICDDPEDRDEYDYARRALLTANR